MTLKKTVRMPVLSDGVPVVVHPHPSERTREIPSDETVAASEQPTPPPFAGVPQPILSDDEVTVPVCSSIESSLTFELLRRQSTHDDEGDKKK